jgi:hypothetical protein
MCQPVKPGKIWQTVIPSSHEHIIGSGVGASDITLNWRMKKGASENFNPEPRETKNPKRQQLNTSLTMIASESSV